MKPALTFLFVTIIHFLFSQSLTVEKIWKEYAFFAKNVEGFRSMNDGIHYTRLSESEGKQNITVHDITQPNSEGTTLVSGDKLKYKNQQIAVDDYYFNDDETKILLITESSPVYRRSYLAVHYLYDIKSGKLEPLDEERQPQTLATYSPDGKKVAYIYKNNIYIRDVATGNTKKLTEDGKRNKVINGTTDWVYEEEFSITQAFGWSPDSKYIGFLKFNEKEVKEFNLTYYGELYPETYTFKYPKAGEANSKVTAHIVAVGSGKITPLDLGEYEYIPRIEWSGTSNKLILQTLNRHQSHLKYHLIDMTGKKPVHKVFFEEKSDTYVEIDNNLIILSDGNSILRTSEADGFNHIYKLTFDGKSSQITKGNWDVIEFYGVNEDKAQIFYAAAEKSPLYKGIYRINLDGNNKTSLSNETGYNEAEFTTGMKYFVKTSSNANTPPTISLCDSEGKELSILEDNSKLKTNLSGYNLSKKEFVTFKSGDTQLNGWMIKPVNFNPEWKYPVYVTIYGGPGHNEVTDSWDGNDYMYHQLLAQKGYIVVSVDPRGTMYRGAAFKKSSYLQLGKLETEDFINVAKELQSYSYVDPQRIGIQGWSYGGFMTSLAMTKGADQFKMGIAVAPVTSWRYYDNIYTERFMRTPQENASGYDENSPINFVSKLKGKYFLIHGSGDDNVHYQNSMEMINALVKANKQFDLFIYPNRNHGIYGGNTRNHLFNMMLDYTLKNL
ncbi:MAG: DPP IV N-terminal domain-containing protein [Cryomorphaceae bacterium]|nr:DPP IV N-terminal domain-containing protein [Cryomorphaceae bacterium]